MLIVAADFLVVELPLLSGLEQSSFWLRLLPSLLLLPVLLPLLLLLLLLLVVSTRAGLPLPGPPVLALRRGLTLVLMKTRLSSSCPAPRSPPPGLLAVERSGRPSLLPSSPSSSALVGR